MATTKYTDVLDGMISKMLPKIAEQVSSSNAFYTHWKKGPGSAQDYTQLGFAGEKVETDEYAPAQQTVTVSSTDLNQGLYYGGSQWQWTERLQALPKPGEMVPYTPGEMPGTYILPDWGEHPQTDEFKKAIEKIMGTQVQAGVLLGHGAPEEEPPPAKIAEVEKPKGRMIRLGKKA